MIVCTICDKNFTRSDNLARHKKTKHGFVGDNDKFTNIATDNETSKSNINDMGYDHGDLISISKIQKIKKGTRNKNIKKNKLKAIKKWRKSATFLKKTNINEKLMKDLIKIKKNLKRKYQELKTARILQEEAQEKIYEPIVKSIKELTNVMTPGTLNNFELNPQIKQEVDKEQEIKLQTDNDDDESFDSFSGATTKNIGEIDIQTPTSSNDINNLVSSKVSPTYGYHRSELDKSYGPYFDSQTETIKLGTSVFQIDERNRNIIIDNEIFESTDGLHELLFKRKPNKNVYTDNDMKKYKKILEKTNAHRRNYDSLDQIKGNTGYKYRNIIRRLFNHEYDTRNKNTTGEGYNHSLNMKVLSQ